MLGHLRFLGLWGSPIKSHLYDLVCLVYFVGFVYFVDFVENNARKARQARKVKGSKQKLFYVLSSKFDVLAGLDI